MPPPHRTAGHADTPTNTPPASRSLTLLAPGLTATGWPRSAGLLEGLELGALEVLLARADRVEGGGQGRDAALRSAFGLDASPTADADADFPVAALTLLNDTGARQPGYWLRADPVHIEAGRDRLTMTGGGGLDIRADEAGALCARINAHLAGEGVQLIAPVPSRWYFRWPAPPEVCFDPLPEVIGGDLFPHMPGGVAGRRWRGLLNEIQMLCHDSPVNQARRAEGRVEISGVWIWGGGELAAAPVCAQGAVWSDDPLARGLALHAGIEVAALPADAADWLRRAGGGAHLVLLDGLEEAQRLGALELWRERLQAIARDWIAPLAAALRGGELDELVICAADGAGYHVTRAALRRWWRRRRPMTDYPLHNQG